MIGMKDQRNRLNVGLNNKQINFIEKIRKQIRESSGKRLSKTATIRAILKAYMGKNIKTGIVKTEKDLEKYLLKSM
jgi:hypothetical protein